jgi:DNA polymerase IV
MFTFCVAGKICVYDICRTEPLVKRVIVHADMDAFFASVEELDHPEYKGKPLIVGSDPENGAGRGVVSTCNYAARKYGIHSAMPISQAWKRCPQGIYLFPDMKRYAEISSRIMEIFHSFSPMVEPLSLDEAFLDCTGTERLFGNASDLGRKIKEKVFKETGLRVSVGIASNKFVAKVASDLEKPDGLTICPEGMEGEFLKNLPIRKLWGVGPKTAEQMNRIGIHTIGDLASLSDSDARRHFKNHGSDLRRLALGKDNRPVEPYSGRKSISEEHTFRFDLDDRSEIEKVLFGLSDHLARRMRKEGLQGKTLQVKIRTSSFHTILRSKTLPEALCDTSGIANEVKILFSKSDPGGLIRLVGIGMSNLSKPGEIAAESPDLFTFADQKKAEKLDKVIDTLKDRFQNRVGRAVFFDKDEKNRSSR